MDKTEKMNFRVSEELKNKIEAHCAKELIPVSQYIRNLIIKDLEVKQEPQGISLNP